MKGERFNKIIKIIGKIDNLVYDDELITASIKSSSDPNKIYTVIIDKKNKYYECNCIGFLSHKKPCKHIKAIAFESYLYGYLSKAEFKEVMNNVWKLAGENQKLIIQ